MDEARGVTAQDPVHEDEGKWWFWDETWADRLGPYNTEEAAREALDLYVKEVLGCCGLSSSASPAERYHYDG